MKLWMNDWGMLGYFSYKNCGCIPQIVGCEYPENTYFEHLGVGSVWIGALVDTSRRRIGQYAKFVTTSDLAVGQVPGHLGEGIISEMSPSDPNNPWHSVSILNDQDSGAVSESDLYTSYNDTAQIPGLKFHTPLGINVFQKSFAWAKGIREPILPIEYNFVNLGKKFLKDVYLGFNFGIDVEVVDSSATHLDNVEGFWPELRTAHVSNPVQRQVTPLGVTIIDIPKRLNESQFRFTWFDVDNESYVCDNFLSEGCDPTFYDYLSGAAFPNQGALRQDQSTNNPTHITFLFSLGPINNWQVGETLKVTIALESGHGLEFGADNLRDNAAFAQTLYNRHYKPPVVLPAPKLRFESGNKKVALRWGYTDVGVNPMNVWDDENAIATVYPPDHWRRINPPSGHTTGGRVFEGFRLYRSEDPGGTANSFTLIKQWDMIDSIGPKFENDTGIETTYVDSNLQTGKTYWYAVTSFGIPDIHVIDYLDFDGAVKKETLLTKSAETSVLASRKRVNLPFSVSHALNQVLVVPNPYRTDENYTLESGGWEGRSLGWTENKRLIRFIHLPPKCTIQIFSLTGDLVTTLEHDDPTRGDLEWNLISESGRALASGVYVFQVDSEYGKQVGKFVLIR